MEAPFKQDILKLAYQQVRNTQHLSNKCFSFLKDDEICGVEQ